MFSKTTCNQCADLGNYEKNFIKKKTKHGITMKFSVSILAGNQSRNIFREKNPKVRKRFHYLDRALLSSSVPRFLPIAKVVHNLTLSSYGLIFLPNFEEMSSYRPNKTELYSDP